MKEKDKAQVQAGGMNATGGGSNQMVERCIIVTRDESGYGLTVSGDNPVFVQSVKEDGAAARAGVRQGDRIIKVHGTLVTGANHMEVVKMISSGTYVALTLLGRPPSSTSSSAASNWSSFSGQTASTVTAGISSTQHPTVRHSIAQMMHQQSTESMQPLPNSNSSSPSNTVKRSTTSVGETKTKDFITGPQPVNEEKQAEWRRKRIQIICQMLEEEKKNVDELLAELKRNASDKTQHFLEQAQKRIKNLESQLSDFKTTQGTDHAVASSQNAPSSLSNKQSLKSSSCDNHTADVSSSSANSTGVGVAAMNKAKQNEGAPSSNSFPSGLHYVAPAQVDVVPMEESDSDDTEAVVPLETEGPFINFAELKNRPAHLAVFLHYLLSNCDPASLLFYLITDLYCHGSSKEMCKWAYEIHSTFLVPTAPLRVSAIDMSVVQEIDAILYSIHDSDHDDVVKKIFVRARQRALDEIIELLSDFRNKRTLGLGNVFGESLLHNLNPGDTSRERKIVDALLMQHFESFFAGTSYFDQLPDRQQALAISLATILRHMNVKPSNSYHEKLFDKCPLFVAKEKKGFTLLAKPSKKAVQIKGHHFVLTPVFVTTFCYQCQEMLWGVNAQEYFCSNCDVVVHKSCAGLLEDTCYGSGRKLPNSRRPPRPRKPPSREESTDAFPPTTVLAHSNSSQPLSVPGATVIAEEPEDRTVADDLEEMDKTTDLPNSPLGKENWGSKSVSADSGYGGDVEKSVNINVGRSQSMKSREEQHRLSKRNGDSGRRTKSDVEKDDKSIALAIGQEGQATDISVSSSSSSVSRASLPESPTTSTDVLLRTSIESSSTSTTTVTQIIDANLSVSDSDLEADSEIPRLEDVLDWETVRHLKPKEKKRQEVMNELFHTERTHVRNLKVLCKVFYEPLLSSGILPPDTVKLLFANIEEVLDLHMKLNSAMKCMFKHNKLIGDIGGLILPFFDGASGEQFRQAVAKFCQHQQHALEALKVRQKKDQKLAQFLQEAECSSVCRKLQLKDMLPMEMQRLTKYPLLLETVAKYTPEPSDEIDKLKKCIECAKGILDAVNTAKRGAENLRRLDELQRRMDTKDFDRVSHIMTKAYKNLDLRQYTLIHDGALTWRLGKNKDLLVLLTRNSDGQRLSLKFHNINVATGKEDVKFTHCPLLKLSSLMAKNVATDKKGIFIVSTSVYGPQIYELVAQSTTEKKTWFKFITDQIDVCKQRDAPANLNVTGLPSSSAISGQKLDDNALNASNSMAPVPTSVDLSQEAKLNDSFVPTETTNVEEDTAPIERIQIISQPRLINPCEVQVCQPTILEHAEPVLTPLERLKRKDELILRSLADKHKILSQIFGFPPDDLSQIAEILMENKGNKGAREMALAAVVQTNRILESINEAMKLKRQEEVEQEQQQVACHRQQQTVDDPIASEFRMVNVEKPAVPCATLTRIAAPLMKHLTGLLHCLQLMDEDLKRVRTELHHYKSLSNSGGKMTDESNEVAVVAMAPASSSSSSSASTNVCKAEVVDVVSKSPMMAAPQTTNIDDYLKPTLSVCTTSSEETLTESKNQTPRVKSPASPAPQVIIAPPPFTSSFGPDAGGETSGVGKQATGDSSDNNVKSPDSSCGDDEEKKREKRKQRRQRHTALSGFDDPRTTTPSDDFGVQFASPLSDRSPSSVSPVRDERTEK